MAGIELIEGLGLILAAASAPVATVQTVAVFDTPSVSGSVTTTAPRRTRTRDERIGAVALRGFPATQQWVPPAKSWGEPGGPVVEVGALGARRSDQPDLAHLSFNWQF
ncbi:MAG: hypothetical protein KGM18_06335 [Sphingomonadales bacterium]|nr:hypothetical protein [Sphingomonadales bacterium]